MRGGSVRRLRSPTDRCHTRPAHRRRPHSTYSVTDIDSVVDRFDTPLTTWAVSIGQETRPISAIKVGEGRHQWRPVLSLLCLRVLCGIGWRLSPISANICSPFRARPSALTRLVILGPAKTLKSRRSPICHWTDRWEPEPRVEWLVKWRDWEARVCRVRGRQVLSEAWLTLFVDLLVVSDRTGLYCNVLCEA